MIFSDFTNFYSNQVGLSGPVSDDHIEQGSEHGDNAVYSAALYGTDDGIDKDDYDDALALLDGALNK